MATESSQPPSFGQEKCPNCGHSAFTWGYLYENAIRPLGFYSDERSGLQKFFVTGGQRLRARACDTCGHVQMFLDIKRR